MNKSTLKSIQGNNLFLFGILTYLIWRFCFYFFAGLTNVLLLYFDVNKYAYLSGLIVSGSISLIIFLKLYKKLTKKGQPSKGTFGLIGILIAIILAYMGINKYVSYLSENSPGIGLDKISYFAYPTFAFGITVIIGILILILKKDESIPNQV